MKINEVAKHVLDNHQCVLIRPKKNSEQGEYDLRDFQGKKKGWVYFDAVTANAVNTVYNALKPESQVKFCQLPLMRVVDFAWKCIK